MFACFAGYIFDSLIFFFYADRWRWGRSEEGYTASGNLCTWNPNVHCPEEQQEVEGVVRAVVAH